MLKPLVTEVPSILEPLLRDLWPGWRRRKKKLFHSSMFPPKLLTRERFLGALTVLLKRTSVIPDETAAGLPTGKSFPANSSLPLALCCLPTPFSCSCSAVSLLFCILFLFASLHPPPSSSSSYSSLLPPLQPLPSSLLPSSSSFIPFCFRLTSDSWYSNAFASDHAETDLAERMSDRSSIRKSLRY